jgi:serine/threonine protein kinase
VLGSVPGGSAEAGSSSQGTGRYRLIEEIARGGMGVIYRARDLVLDRDVGVKTVGTLVPADSPRLRRFRDEAHITGQLQHPAIPPVHDLGVLPDGRPFLAMKLIKGRALDVILRERTDPSADRGRLIAVFEQVCQAVAYAHSQGVIHRDLKPANMMVGSFGEVQVMDWGLVRQQKGWGSDAGSVAPDVLVARDAASETRAGSVIGTPSYMPPEQARGEVDRHDRRSDVFGLGAILCVILTGHPPFEGTNEGHAVALAATGDVSAAFARLDGCEEDPELVALCKSCLDPQPDCRPADAGDVAAAVAAHRAGAEQRARTAELEKAQVETRAAEQRKRWRIRVIALVVLLGAALLATGFAYWAGSEFNRASRFESAASHAEELQKKIDEMRREQYEKDKPIHRDSAANRLGEYKFHYQLVKSAFFPSGPTDGPAGKYTRLVIRSLMPWDLRDVPSVLRDEVNLLPETLHFVAELHRDLGELEQAASLLIVLADYHTQVARSTTSDDRFRERLADECVLLAGRLQELGKVEESLSPLRIAISCFDQMIRPLEATKRPLKGVTRDWLKLELNGQKPSWVWATIPGPRRNMSDLLAWGVQRCPTAYLTPITPSASPGPSPSGRPRRPTTYSGRRRKLRPVARFSLRTPTNDPRRNSRARTGPVPSTTPSLRDGVCFGPLASFRWHRPTRLSQVETRMPCGR